ncbi:PIN domain-containing protein [Endozoicomonas sp. SCSIO W0465]|uniref:PIN domain-containing protein n=1 Tax=Endozoicomonas sp. SCSIO W0465 TaxID=2918516 RepID=UPI002075194C|nr:PIN domain-containing protein [Endozoicomonas sp. SCSIO W0465]USE35714.1 PIN domain-containing protein [Endozoicomonas sp. SCSIO W0465]
MSILVDTNVILDVLLEREPFAQNSSRIMALVERRACTGYLCATTLTTIHYLACKTIGKEAGQQAIQTLLQIYRVAPVDHQVLQMALNTGFKDYEDSVLYASGVNAGTGAIITRNVKDFSASELPVYTPEEYLINKVSS